MPFKTIDDLPDSVKHVLPMHAQHIYKEAFNNAYEEYKHPEKRRDDTDREEVSHRVAWSAVKHKYQKGDDGAWHPVE
jgi:cation transport regulator